MPNKLDDQELAKLLVICELAGKNPDAKTVDVCFDRKLKEVEKYLASQVQ